MKKIKTGMRNKELSVEQLRELARAIASELCRGVEIPLERAVSVHLRKYSDILLTSRQAAEFLGKTKADIDQMCRRNQIPYHKKDGRRFFSRNELIDYFTQ